jgi:GMP synthase (glutamine-hydrolysing)
MPCNISAVAIKEYAPKAIILSGGGESVTDETAPKIPQSIYSLGVPILGICYGQQALARDFGSKVVAGQARTFGSSKLSVISQDPFFAGLWQEGEAYEVWMSHGDYIAELAEDFKVLAATDNAPYAVIKHKDKDIYGIQFHPEVYHTPSGTELLGKFLIGIAHLQQTWRMNNFITEAIENIRTQVGDGEVVLGLSGGVDSTVVAALLQRAIGDKLYCVFVDNGLLRHDEAVEVEKNFKANFKANFIKVDAQNDFMSELSGITDPEAKRKVIGKLFIDKFQQEIKKLGKIKFLAQGTIYPDCIESYAESSGKKITIKSHHNVGGLPELKSLELVEPLRQLFKDEVRLLGRELGISDSILARHPFPGPGLGIRIVGEVNKEKCKILRKADHIYISILKETGLYHKIWQAYAALLSTKTVGVMGDNRTYEYICVLRAVTSADGMTADYFDLPHDVLGLIARRIVNEVPGINRVVYDVTSKPPATIELE